MKYLFSFIALISISTSSVYGQAGGDQLTQLLESKKFTFYATNAMPQNSADIARVMQNFPGSGGGSNIILDQSTYQVKFQGDSIVSFLPFYGRNFTPSMNPADKGIKFTAKDFDYAVKRSKKGNSQIDVKLKDVRAHQRLSFNVTSNGYATLTVTSVDRSSIAYSGYVDATKIK